MASLPGGAAMDIPEIAIATTDDGVKLAYQTIGDGPIDIVYVPGCESNIELNWDYPPLARCLRRLASFSRLIVLDRRGTGCSDRLSPDDLPPLETQADDLRVVMDEGGSVRAALLAFDAGNILSCLVRGSVARARDGSGPQSGRSLAERHRSITRGGGTRGSGTRIWTRWRRVGVRVPTRESFLRWIAPSDADDERLCLVRSVLRQTVSPAAAVALEALSRDTDIRSVLPSIHVPTLVLHHSDDPMEPVEGGRYIAGHIPAARFVELPGYRTPMLGLPDADIDEIEEFLTGCVRSRSRLDRVLATVLFTDIVGSTERRLSWATSVEASYSPRHDERARAEIARHRGRYVHSTGDGLFATFDGPARAVRCAQAIGEAVRRSGSRSAAGVHTGEMELAGDDVRGIAVHIGARVAALGGRIRGAGVLDREGPRRGSGSLRRCRRA